MAAVDLTQFYLYRWRYILGYGAVFVALVALLGFAGFYIPGGLSSDEMKAVVKTSSISLTDFASYGITNLPYHMLQAASIHFLGVTDLSVKLPSLIIGLASALGLIALLSTWFRRNIAVLGSLIAVTTGQFLFVAQSGTASIAYIFWPIMLLLLGTLITRGARLQFLWRVLFFLTAALSLYTPLSIYPVAAMALAAILHPHLRNVLRKMVRIKLIFAMVLGIIIVSPLVYAVVRDPGFGLTLLGIPQAFPDLINNGQRLLEQYVLFWQPSSTTLMTPVFGLGSALLILYGLVHVIRTRESTQSYLIASWLVCLIPVLVINPAFTSVMFLPLVLLLTIGLDRLIVHWYRLFPLNPYARIAGLLPLIVLVFGLITSGLDRYVYGYYYQPGTASNFNKDLSLLPKSTATLLVSTSEQPFYEVLAQHQPGLSVVTTIPTTDSFTVTKKANQPFGGYKVDHIVTSSSAKDADRFYVYKKSTD